MTLRLVIGKKNQKPICRDEILAPLSDFYNLLLQHKRYIFTYILLFIAYF